MSNYRNPENEFFTGLARCYIASKAGGVVLPHVMDIHPVSGRCNLDCRWCIGRFQRGTIDPLPNLLDGDGMVLALKKILDPRWRSLWPSEFHFCGCDSEPLLSDTVLPAIKLLLQRGRIVELLTNGLLLDTSGTIPVVARISKLNISLDVSNNQDYRAFKYPEGHGYDDGYSRVVSNLMKIASYSQRNKQLLISVSFVATPKTYDKQKWRSCFEELRDAGAQEIRVRDDLNETFGPRIKGLKDDMEDIDKDLTRLKIRFISPEQPYSDFPYCRAPRLWPTLAADGCLYPCAHTATTQYQPFGDLLGADSLFYLYQQLFQVPRRSFIPVEEIGCKRFCPSTLGLYNEPSLAEGQLGRESYV